MLSIPDGYTLLEPKPGLRLLVRQGLDQLVEQHGLADFPSLPRDVGSYPAGGRGAIRRIGIGDRGTLVVKIYRRGGLAGRFRGDTYRGVSRAMEEVRICLAAREADLRVPEIQCLWMEQAGPFRYRLAAATMEIPRAEDIFHALARLQETPEERHDLLVAIADEVRKLHDAGILHPDLNLGNILVTRDAGSTPEIHLIDFDRASLRDGPLATGERNGALIRMYRSLVKLSLPDPPPLTVEEKELFLSTYWRNVDDPNRDLRRRCHRELARHRLWWRLKPPAKNR